MLLLSLHPSPVLQFLTQEDFEQIRAKQLAQKLKPSMSRKRKAQEIEKELLEASVEEEAERYTGTVVVVSPVEMFQLCMLS